MQPQRRVEAILKGVLEGYLLITEGATTGSTRRHFSRDWKQWLGIRDGRG